MTPLSKSIILIAITVGTIVACKKESTTIDADVRLTENDSGKSISVSQGETIAVTTSDPGDAGYQVIDPIFNSSVLTLNSRTHQNPKDVNMLGDWGTYTWKFTVISNGKTDLKIPIIRRIGIDTLWGFRANIEVK